MDSKELFSKIEVSITEPQDQPGEQIQENAIQEDALRIEEVTGNCNNVAVKSPMQSIFHSESMDLALNDTQAQPLGALHELSPDAEPTPGASVITQPIAFEGKAAKPMVRKATNRGSPKKKKRKLKAGKPKYKCVACGQLFNSESGFRNHIASSCNELSKAYPLRHCEHCQEEESIGRSFVHQAQ